MTFLTRRFGCNFLFTALFMGTTTGCPAGGGNGLAINTQPTTERLSGDLIQTTVDVHCFGDCTNQRPYCVVVDWLSHSCDDPQSATVVDVDKQCWTPSMGTNDDLIFNLTTNIPITHSSIQRSWFGADLGHDDCVKSFGSQPFIDGTVTIIDSNGETLPPVAPGCDCSDSTATATIENP